jgi:hypothetical protein
MAPKIVTRAPQVLGPTRLIMLFKLWRCGYDSPHHAEHSELGALQELRRMGYAERDPTSINAGWWRITQDGMDRLVAPMRLTRSKHLSLVK